MYILIIMSSMIMIITYMMLNMATLLSKKTNIDREKASPFECGFDPKSSARMPFSMRFFLIAVIFLIFDVEIALLLPMPIIPHNSTIMHWMLVSSTFLLILLGGLFHEWNQGSLNWAH